MLGKFGILITILVLVFLFFIVISFSAGAFSKEQVKPETKISTVKIDSGQFSDLVEKIIERNSFKPFPDINDIPN